MSEFPNCFHACEVPMPRVLPVRMCDLLHGEMHSHHFGLGMVLDPAVCEGCPDRAPGSPAAPREEAMEFPA